jgi:hypothetical protein
MSALALARNRPGAPPGHENAAAQVSPWRGGKSETEASQLQEQSYPEADLEATTSRLPSPLRLARGELDHRAATPSRQHVHYWREHRLDPAMVAGFAGLLAVLPMRVFPQERFDFGEDGDPLGAVVEAFDEDGETVLDLVAWPIAEPERVLSMFGRAPVLGMWAAMDPATFIFDRPLMVHRTPLDWLKSGCHGCAIVVPRLAARLFVELPGQIAAQDMPHARELRALLQSVVDVSRIVLPVPEAA